jgi:hypothetical protein
MRILAEGCMEFGANEKNVFERNNYWANVRVPEINITNSNKLF